MERSFDLTKEELDKILSLYNINSIIKEDYNFEKWLLELEKNIAIGNNFNGVLFDKHYMLDDKVLIEKTEELHDSLMINPLPFEKEKLKISTVSKKASLFSLNDNKLSVLCIQDMIIDDTSLIANYKPTKVLFINCFFTDNVSLGSNYISELEFQYCSLPSFNILSNVDTKNIKITNSKFREDNQKFNRINAAELEIKGTNFNCKKLFYYSSFEKLRNLEISGKVFSDDDLIMLDQIAPILEKARLNITLKDLKTFDKINPLIYFEFPNNFDFSGKEIPFERNYNFVSNSTIKYRISKKERLETIDNIETSINSLFKKKEYRNFLPKQIFLEEIYQILNEYKIDKDDDKLKKSMLLALNKLKQNILIEDINYEVKKDILLLIEKQMGEEIFYYHIESAAYQIFRPLYNNIENMTLYAKQFNYENFVSKHNISPLYIDGININVDSELCDELYVINPMCIDRSILRMDEALLKYKNNKIKVFDFFEVLLINNCKISFMHIFKNNKNYNFYKNLRLNRTELEYINSHIKGESIEPDQLLELIDKKDNIDQLGIALPCSVNVFDNQYYKSFDYKLFEKRRKRTKISNVEKGIESVSLKHLVDHINSVHSRKTEHEKMLSSCNQSKYEEVHEKMLKYKKSIRTQKFEEIYGSSNQYNIEDYNIYLEGKRKGNYKSIYKKICLNILYENKEKLMSLTKEDYNNIKTFIFDNYNIKSQYNYHMDLCIYYEVIKYVTNKYPDFLERYISSYEPDLEVCDKSLIATIGFLREKEREALIFKINKSRTDYNQKTLIR